MSRLSYFEVISIAMCVPLVMYRPIEPDVATQRRDSTRTRSRSYSNLACSNRACSSLLILQPNLILLSKSRPPTWFEPRVLVLYGLSILLKSGLHLYHRAAWSPVAEECPYNYKCGRIKKAIPSPVLSESPCRCQIT